jgi:hydrogenase maturation protease
MLPRVLGLGNELLGDDAVGVIAARQVGQDLAGQVEVIETSVYGLGLLDVVLGCRQLIIIDAVKTGKVPPGTVLQIDPATLDQVIAPSPHYCGLPEMRVLARTLNLDFPGQIAIFAMEIADGSRLETKLSREVEAGLATLIWRVKEQLAEWSVQPPLSSDRMSEDRGRRLPTRRNVTAEQKPC